ncbi:hypothetical protein F6X40_10855 [Paraburkholderia sp. UCT31]|uniref:hypothetical protein n=1 Tax=Paraburkholderia sp. UCT31 TaxID=2615209 RepID=UPI001655F5C8|nr:hypothetical protein [Paraburkholderia sp. UCT31]MBC8737306.1 hypothetical protein [Paraburkholderia sp. UCT31]
MQVSQPPTFLVELLDSESGEIERSDVTRHLSNALEQVYLHVMEDRDAEISTEVSIDRDGELQGIHFVDQHRERRALITAYYLDRDEPEGVIDELGVIAQAALPDLQAALKRFFRP